MRRTTVPKLRYGLAATVPWLIAPWAALAETPPSSSASPSATAALSASELQKAIESRNLEIENKKLSEKTIDAELVKLNERLLETAARVQKHEGKLTIIEGRISELEVQEKILKGSLAEREGELSELLAALQRMGRNPPPVMITKREDALEMVRSAMLLSTAFPSLRSQASEVAGKLEGLVAVMDGLRTEKQKQETENTALTEQRTALAGLMAEKKRSRATLQAEIAELSKGVAEMAKTASGLKELIAKSDSAVKSSTGLGAYEAEVKVKEAEPQSAPASIAAAAAVPPPQPPEAATKPAEQPAPAAAAVAQTAADTGQTPAKPTEVALAIPPPKPPAPPKPSDNMVELAPVVGSLVPGSPGRIKPSIEFASAKGRLPLPAQGRRALTFGDKTQFGNTSQGVVLETRANAQVTSPCDGWIVWSGEFRSYGQLLIINAGGGYHVLLAGLSQIDVQPGQFVLAAEPVGTMGGMPKSSSGAAENSGPVLYVEFRKDGEPVDPDPWWVQQKAQK